MLGPSYPVDKMPFWMVDLPPENPTAWDQEFFIDAQYAMKNTRPPERMAEYNPNSTISSGAYDAIRGYSWYQTTRTGANLNGFYFPFPPFGVSTFSFFARVGIQSGLNSVAGTGLAIFENATNYSLKATAVMLCGDMNIRVQNWSSSTVINATVNTTLHSGAHSVYLAFMATGGTQSCWSSMDGLAWQNLTWVGSPYVTTPLHVGIVSKNDNLSYTSDHWCKFLRYLPSYPGSAAIRGRLVNLSVDPR